MKNKQKTPGKNGQYYIRFCKKNDWEKIFNWLVEQNYSNPHSYTKEVYPKDPSVFRIDERSKSFFGTNITCMACAVSVGHRVIEFEEFLIRHNE